MILLKKIYIVRHCKAEGQASNSPLTEIGFKQAEELDAFFNNVPVERIISSPYMRAVQTIQPLAERLNVKLK